MNLYFRFVFLFLRRLGLGAKASILDACRTRFWVNPLDLDINLHMNNGRYLSIMDLGRTDLMLKTGSFWPLFSKGYYPVVVSESIRFKKSLAPFQFFDVITRVESWNEKDFFMTQHFVVGEEIYAIGYIKGRFRRRGQKQSVPTAEIFSMMGESFARERLSEIAEAQIRIENELNQYPVPAAGQGHLSYEESNL